MSPSPSPLLVRLEAKQLAKRIERLLAETSAPEKSEAAFAELSRIVVAARSEEATRRRTRVTNLYQARRSRRFLLSLFSKERLRAIRRWKLRLAEEESIDDDVLAALLKEYPNAQVLAEALNFKWSVKIANQLLDERPSIWLTKRLQKVVPLGLRKIKELHGKTPL